MPEPALPVPLGARPTTPIFRQLYIDPLGRPMQSGSVVITAVRRLSHEAGVMPADSSVTVVLVDGVLEADLRPGVYRLRATLQTLDGHGVVDTATITITG